MAETSETVSTAAPTAPAVKVGDKVFYVPDDCHQFDKDHKDEFVFAFHYASDSRNPRVKYRQGERVTEWDKIGIKTSQWRWHKSGAIQTGGGHLIEVGEPLAPWPAIVREVFADGTVALDVAHPIGGSLLIGHSTFERGTFLTLHYPSQAVTAAIKAAASGAKTVPITDPQTGAVTEHKCAGLSYSTDGEPHTWHLLADAKGA